MMKYRKYFHLTYQQFIDTPLDVIYTDLEMMNIESKLESDFQKKEMAKMKK